MEHVLGIGAVAILAAAAVTLGVLGAGTLRWTRRRSAFLGRVRAASHALPALYFEGELAGLPEPVARYFKWALRDGQPRATHASLTQEGSLQMGKTARTWKPFTAEQEVNAAPPAFLWDARVRLFPGLCAFVRDSFLGGTGTMHGEVLGLFTVVHASGGREMGEGSLLRYLAEGPWLPTALLPSAGVRWTPLDDHSALATLEDGGVRAQIRFTFGPGGEITDAFAQARGREVDGEFVPTPWQGHFGDYEERGGMRVPLEGAVQWLLPEGPLPYWRGRVTSIEYDTKR